MNASELIAALEFARLQHTQDPGVRALRRYLDSWTGLGDVIEAMGREDFDIALERLDGAGWRATFFVAGREHSPNRFSAAALAPSPGRAVGRAAWDALARRPG